MLSNSIIIKAIFMKNIIFMAGLSLMLVSCNNEGKAPEIPKNSDWVADNLKGRVKTVEIINYTPDSTGAIGEPDSCCADVQQYDENGYFTSYESKTKNGSISASGTATRHPNGQMKEMINNKDGKMQARFAIEVDADGKYIKATSYDSTNTMDLYYTDITENEYGQVTGAIGHHPDGSVKESFASQYNGSINMGSTTKDSVGKAKNEFKIEVNDKNDRAKTINTTYGKDSTTTKTFTYTYETYDDQGNWTQRTTHDENGKATKVEKRTITYYPTKD